jgi:hypothetical protein
MTTGGRPEGIPDDVWQDAAYAVTAAPEYTLYLHERVARAILAERESNAMKADEQAAREEYGHAKHACVTIAQNIRNGEA